MATPEGDRRQIPITINCTPEALDAWEKLAVEDGVGLTEELRIMISRGMNVTEQLASGHVQVKVNCNSDVYAAWKQLALRHGVSLTGEQQIMVSRSIFIDEQLAAGNKFAIIDGNGKVKRITFQEGNRPTPGLNPQDR